MVGEGGTILHELFACRRDTQYNEKPKVIRKLSNTRNKDNMRFLEKIILVQRTVNNQSLTIRMICEQNKPKYQVRVRCNTATH